MYLKVGKRLFDLLLSSIALLALAPLLLLVSLVLLVTNHGQVFFTQSRPGRDERVFRIIKFKTMVDAYGDDGELLPDHQRITTVGRLVRKSSLDELLQLINVVRGEMSLIGPRPLLVEYLPRYSKQQRRRHEVRPGITGLAQVKGRNNLAWAKRFRYDVFYVDRVSFSFDLLILWWTVLRVLSSTGTGGDSGKFIGKQNSKAVDNGRDEKAG